MIQNPLEENDIKYRTLNIIGEGAFGYVQRAEDGTSGQQYAVKHVLLRTHRDGNAGTEITIPLGVFREIQALRQLAGHENIVRLLLVQPKRAGLDLVLEYMQTDLAQVLEKLHVLTEQQSRYVLLGILRGVGHCHSLGIMHRDIKPGNVLVDESLQTVKVADFGLCRVLEVGEGEGEGKGGGRYSHQVSTRWYRAPEILFGSEHYSEKIDLWSIGAVAAEVMIGAPVFHGMNDIEQIVKVFQVLGTPNRDNWPQIDALPDYGKIMFKHFQPRSFDAVIPRASHIFREFVQQLLRYDETTRPSCTEAITALLHVPE